MENGGGGAKLALPTMKYCSASVCGSGVSVKLPPDKWRGGTIKVPVTGNAAGS